MSKWTTEKPTKAGYYWVRAHIPDVHGDMIVAEMSRDNSPLYVVNETIESFFVDGTALEYQGPLEPED